MKGRVEYSNVHHRARQVLMRFFTQRRVKDTDATETVDPPLRLCVLCAFA